MLFSMVLSLLCLGLTSGVVASASSVFLDASPEVAKTAVKVSHFDFTLTWETGAPDGYSRSMIFVNGQFPGPTLHIDQGDSVEVVVNNQLRFNTTVHFHGLALLGTPWSDGVPGLSQRPIQPGHSFTYKWTATQYGSYFYHAHYRGQIDDGLYGAIVIRPSPQEPRPFKTISQDPAKLSAMEAAELNVRPLILSDWLHITFEEGWELENTAGVELGCVHSLLVNGKGSAMCWSRDEIDKWTTPLQAKFLNGLKLTDKGCIPAQVLAGLGTIPTNLSAIPPHAFDVCIPTQGSSEVIEVSPGTVGQEGWVAFDLIGAASLNLPMFSIDEHPLWVYAVDGRYIEPVQVNAITVPNGNRYSVLAALNKPVGNYSIRISNVFITQNICATATLSYKSVSQPTASQTAASSIPYINVVGGNTTADVVFFDDYHMNSFPASSPAPTADATYILNVTLNGASYRWALNNTRYDMSLQDSAPLLFDPVNSLPHNDNLTITTRNGTWIDLIFVVGPNHPQHPIHKHTNKAYVIGSGVGDFPYSSVAEAMAHIPGSFNLATPPLRDGFTTLSTLDGSMMWLAVRYQVVNPGAWLIHCHIQDHLSGGMAMVILDGVDRWPEVPEEYRDYY